MHAFPTLLVLIAACQEPTRAEAVGAPEDSAQPDPSPTVEVRVEDDEASVVINELMAANDSVVMDERGETADWVELYNRGDETIALSGWALGGAAEDGPVWPLPEHLSLAPGETALFWLDDEPEQGDRHATLKLDAEHDALTLFDPDGATETWSFEDQTADVALGRFPDGGANIDATVYATPSNPNPWDPGLNKDPSELLFPEDEILRFDLWLPEDSLEALDNDPYTWVEGAIGFQGVYLSPVGVHIKGAWGSLRELDEKVALKVKVNASLEGQRLRGLQKLTFNNMVQDPSCVHERLAYQVFRASGVPAPRTGYAEIYLNGEYRGLYAHVESEDDVFLARWFDDARGNLYEGAYGPDVTRSGYTSLDLDQDGDDDVEPYSDLAALGALLAERPSEDLVPDLEALVDVDEVLHLFAAEVMTGHWDGYFWYPNNYRIYHDPGTGLLSVLPWGTDQTFSYGEGTFSPSGYLAWWCLAVPSLKQRYMLALWDVYDHMGQLDLAADAREAHDLIRDALEADPYKETSLSESNSYLSSTLSFLEVYPDGVMAEVFPDGVPGVQ